MTPKTDGNTPDPLVDSIIANRYKIIRRIARGGMATVYLASDEALHRQVAIKVLEPPKVTDDPARLLERFRREAESLAQLNHRHIVTIFDYGPTEYGGYFLVMEFVDGQSLSDALKEAEIEPERAVRLMAQIGRALRYAHRKNIVHRDLKPGNILLGREDDEDVAKLVDFGLVKTDDEALTHHGLILGSVHCMAPEQIRGRGIDQRTDIYAFGCCLYRLLCGQYPFPSKVPTEVLASHIHAAVPSFAEVGAAGRVSPEIEQVVMKCLEKEAEARFQTVEEVLEALGGASRLADDASASIANSGQHPPLEDSVAVRRSTVPWLWLGAAAAAAVLLLGVGTVGFAVVGTDLFGEDVQGSVASAATGSAAAAVEPPPEPTPPMETAPDPGEAEAAGAPTEPVAEAPDPLSGATSAPEGLAEPTPEPPPVVKVAAKPPVKRPAAVKTEPAKTEPAKTEPAKTEPVTATAAAPPPTKSEGTAAAAPAPDIVLQSVDVDATGGVRITLQMSNASVRPLHFLMEGASDEYPMQYVVEFKGGATEVGQRIPVASALVDSVTMSSKKGKLRISVNSKQPVQFKFDGNGPTWTITVSSL